MRVYTPPSLQSKSPARETGSSTHPNLFHRPRPNGALNRPQFKQKSNGSGSHINNIVSQFEQTSDHETAGDAILLKSVPPTKMNEPNQSTATRSPPSASRLHQLEDSEGKQAPPAKIVEHREPRKWGQTGGDLTQRKMEHLASRRGSTLRGMTADQSQTHRDTAFEIKTTIIENSAIVLENSTLTPNEPSTTLQSTYDDNKPTESGFLVTELSQKASHAIQALDRNNDGCISASDFLDINGDGKIDFNDFNPFAQPRPPPLTSQPASIALEEAPASDVATHDRIPKLPPLSHEVSAVSLRSARRSARTPSNRIESTASPRTVTDEGPNKTSAREDHPTIGKLGNMDGSRKAAIKAMIPRLDTRSSQPRCGDFTADHLMEDTPEKSAREAPPSSRRKLQPSASESNLLSECVTSTAQSDDSSTSEGSNISNVTRSSSTSSLHAAHTPELSITERDRRLKKSAALSNMIQEARARRNGGADSHRLRAAAAIRSQSQIKNRTNHRKSAFSSEFLNPEEAEKDGPETSRGKVNASMSTHTCTSSLLARLGRPNACRNHTMTRCMLAFAQICIRSCRLYRLNYLCRQRYLHATMDQRPLAKGGDHLQRQLANLREHTQQHSIVIKQKTRQLSKRRIEKRLPYRMTRMRLCWSSNCRLQIQTRRFH